MNDELLSINDAYINETSYIIKIIKTIQKAPFLYYKSIDQNIIKSLNFRHNTDVGSSLNGSRTIRHSLTLI